MTSTIFAANNNYLLKLGIKFNSDPSLFVVRHAKAQIKKTFQDTAIEFDNPQFNILTPGEMIGSITGGSVQLLLSRQLPNLRVPLTMQILVHP